MRDEEIKFERKGEKLWKNLREKEGRIWHLKNTLEISLLLALFRIFVSPNSSSYSRFVLFFLSLFFLSLYIFPISLYSRSGSFILYHRLVLFFHITAHTLCLSSSCWKTPPLSLSLSLSLSSLLFPLFSSFSLFILPFSAYLEFSQVSTPPLFFFLQFFKSQTHFFAFSLSNFYDS